MNEIAWVGMMLGLSIPTALAWRYLNRVRGSDDRPALLPNKAVILTLMGIISGISTTLAAFHTFGFHWAFLAILPLEALLVNLAMRSSWGEIFPAENDTFMEKFAAGVVGFTNWLVGYKYDAETAQDERELFWKQCAWVARMGIYGTPLALLKCAVTLSPLPLVIWWLASLWVGMIYRRAQINETDPLKKVPVAEKTTGWFLGFILTLMGIA